MTMLDAREASGQPTGASIGLFETTDATRTIADLVEEVGFLKNRTRIHVADSNGVRVAAPDEPPERTSMSRIWGAVPAHSSRYHPTAYARAGW